MSKTLIFIDDSGDPGFKNVSSSHFVMAAAVFIEPETAFRLSQQVSQFRNSLGWHENHEFKFAKTQKAIVAELLKRIVEYDFQIYAVFIEKEKSQFNSAILGKEKLYNWMIKELLLLTPFSEAKIEIDGRSSKEYMWKTAAYLRREIGNEKRAQIKFEDSTGDNLIQVADLIAGSINRYLCGDKTDFDKYWKIIKRRVVKIENIKKAEK